MSRPQSSVVPSANTIQRIERSGKGTDRASIPHKLGIISKVMLAQFRVLAAKSRSDIYDTSHFLVNQNIAVSFPMHTMIPAIQALNPRGNLEIRNR